MNPPASPMRIQCLVTCVSISNAAATGLRMIVASAIPSRKSTGITFRSKASRHTSVNAGTAPSRSPNQLTVAEMRSSDWQKTTNPPRRSKPSTTTTRTPFRAALGIGLSTCADQTTPLPVAREYPACSKSSPRWPLANIKSLEAKDVSFSNSTITSASRNRMRETPEPARTIVPARLAASTSSLANRPRSTRNPAAPCKAGRAVFEKSTL